MTYETYHTVFLSAGILAIIFAVCSVLLFVLLKIPKVVGDLSGRTARKGIADIQRVGKTVNTGVMTQKINTQESEEILEASETTVLPTAEYSETVVLDEIRMDDDFSIEEEICFIHTDETIG